MEIPTQDKTIQGRKQTIMCHASSCITQKNTWENQNRNLYVCIFSWLEDSAWDWFKNNFKLFFFNSHLMFNICFGVSTNLNLYHIRFIKRKSESYIWKTYWWWSKLRGLFSFDTTSTEVELHTPKGGQMTPFVDFFSEYINIVQYILIVEHSCHKRKW